MSLLRAAWPALLVLLAGCAGPDRAADAAGGGEATALASPEGAYLAYEHDVRVQIAGEQISSRLKQLGEACQKARFGDCAVLETGEEGGQVPSASIRMRLAPAAVDPFIELAGGDGRVVSRTSRAEDLAQQVADTALTQARLKKEYDTLLGYQQRRDLAVADLLTVSQRLAELEAGMEQAARDAAQQRRRIDTQLLTVRLQAPAAETGRNQIGEAMRDSGAVFTASVAFVIRAVAALVPVSLVLWLLGWAGLTLWRRRRRSG